MAADSTRVPASVLPAIDRIRDQHERNRSGPPAATVLFLAGAGRSGSTLIDRLIGQFDAFVALGEVAWIWEVGVQRNDLCGCGKHYHDCPFWSAVFDRAIGGIDQVDADAMQDFWRRNHELLGPNRRLYATAGGRRRLADATDCTAIMEAIYLAAHEVSGARVLFDTSKALMAPIVLRSSRILDTRLMQLVRDPRAVCYSWATPKPDPTRGAGELTDRRAVPASAAWWLANNLIAEAIRRDYGDRSSLLRYEDFVADPAGELIRLAAMAGEEIDPSVVLSDDPPPLREGHSVWGNAIRFDSRITVRADERWKAALPRADRLTASLIATPLLHRYGYPFSTGSSSER